MRWLFLFAYTCSGFAGLVYEVSWTRLLTLYIGHTTAAASAPSVSCSTKAHMVTAVRTLDDILRRMHAHQAKKRSMLRELRLAHSLPSGP